MRIKAFFFALLATLCLLRPVFATDIIYPYTFANGQLLPASQLNGNFDAVTDVVNGGITNGNIDASAAIALSKLALTSTALNLMATGNPTWASGITGDTQPRITLYSNGVLAFGAGSASAVDIILKRTDANTLAIRNFADDADKNLTAGALTLSTPLVVGSGGTGAATAAAYSVFSVNNSGTAAPAFNAQVGEMLPAGTKIFGGGGSSSSFRALPAMSGVVTLTGDYWNYGTFTDAAATSITCNRCRIFNRGGTFTITKVWTVNTENPGGLASNTATGSTSGDGVGFGHGMGSQWFTASVACGGSGGGHGGAGGASGGTSANQTVAGGQTYPIELSLSGSGGGGGASAATASAGGAGGGSFYLESSGAVFISGTINADGGAASAAATNGSGGGGGSGGGVQIISNGAVDLTGGTITARGGAGGNAAGSGSAGGGGGGGIIMIRAGGTYTAGTLTVTGGGAGTGGTQAATAGSSGTTDTAGSTAYPSRSPS